MAAPEAKTIRDMTGIWVLNRQLSDDIDPTFALQGIPWMLRKVLSFAGVSLHMNQSAGPPEEDPNGDEIVSIRCKQVITPGGFNSEDTYILNGQSRSVSVPIFGTLSIHANYVPLTELEDADLRDRLKEGSAGCEVALEEVAESQAGWQSKGIWGFQIIDGKRYFTRTNITSKGDDTVFASLVYDYRVDE